MRLPAGRRGRMPLRPCTRSGKVSIHPTASLCRREMIELGQRVQVGEHAIIRAHDQPVRIGAFSQVGPFVVILGGVGVMIGANVMIAPHVVIAAGNHDYIQTEKPMRFAGNLSKGPIVIEDNVWIGANVTITDGVRIGRDAVIGANSVVTHDVEPFDVVGGVPARVLFNRKNQLRRAG